MAAQSFEHAMRTAHQWLASGSAGKHKIQVDGKWQSTNKRAYVESQGSTELKTVLLAAAIQIATSSNKFELDKERALFAADLYHYLVNSYATMGMEELINKLEGIEKALNGV